MESFRKSLPTERSEARLADHVPLTVVVAEKLPDSANTAEVVAVEILVPLEPSSPEPFPEPLVPLSPSRAET